MPLNRVSHGTSLLAPGPGSLARRRLARAVHHHRLCPFVVVTAEVFFYTDTKTTQKPLHVRLPPFFITGTCLGFAPLRGTCSARRNFRRNRREKNKTSRKKPPPLAVGGGHMAVFAAPPWRSLRHCGLLRTRPVFTGGGLSWFFNLAVKTP